MIFTVLSSTVFTSIWLLLIFKISYLGATGDPADGARLQLRLREVLQALEGEESWRRTIQHRRQKCLYQGLYSLYTHQGVLLLSNKIVYLLFKDI